MNAWLVFSYICLASVGMLVAVTFLADGLARAGFPLQDPAKRLGAVDGLRGYLALGVMVSHSQGWFTVVRYGATWGDHLLPSLKLGDIAVALFFMATGLVFYPRVRAGFVEVNWIAVLIGRLFRLMPLILLSVAIIVAIIAVRQHQAPGPADLPGVLRWILTVSSPPLMGFAQSWMVNAGVLWSLKLEWLFYLFLLPGSAILMQIARHLRIPSFVLPVTLLGEAFIGKAAGMRYAIGALDWYCSFIALFAAGMLSYEVRDRDRLRALLSSRATTIPAIACLVGGGVLWSGWEHGNVVAILLFTGFFAAVACGNDLFGILRTRGALVLGDCSYGIYLFHGIVLFLTYDMARTWVGGLNEVGLALLLVPLGMVAVLWTAAMYVWIEKPCIRMGKLISGKVGFSRWKPGKGELSIAP